MANVLDALAGDANSATGLSTQAAVVQTMLNSFNCTAMANCDALAPYGTSRTKVKMTKMT